MAAADRKITYTAAEVAELIRPLTQSVESLQKENAEVKRKLEHMNEILANAQTPSGSNAAHGSAHGAAVPGQIRKGEKAKAFSPYTGSGQIT